MDISKIFQVFGSGSNYANKTLVDMEDNPIMLLGMFRKLITNNLNFTKKIERNLGKSLFEIDKKQIQRAGELVVFNRAWNYISKVNPNNMEVEAAIALVATEQLLKCIKISLGYFENLEEYEKCSHLKSIQDKIEISIAENLEI